MINKNKRLGFQKEEEIVKGTEMAYATENQYSLKQDTLFPGIKSYFCTYQAI